MCVFRMLMWWDEVLLCVVVLSLGMWTCGTQVCFGGYFVIWLEFWQMGLFIEIVEVDHV